ncbi:MAG TPA: ornithine aminomutase [Clostridiales bacterium UBA8153]|nr:ornithine aminomutase [Clostridiales bacterium UBA8153]
MADFSERRERLAHLTDGELKERFWQLAHQVVAPMVELARTHTSPSIERAVILRMGFSSLEAKAIVDRCIDHGLLGQGAGGLVCRAARSFGLSIREAGLAMAQGQLWADLKGGGPGAQAR